MWANAFTGVPYEAGGRSMAGADCWGLVRMAIMHRCGVDLPSFGEIDADDLRAVHRAMAGERDRGTWREAENPADCDIVLMRGTFDGTDGRLKGGATHVGCCVDGTHLLHTERGIGATLVPLNHWTVKGRILRFYRPS
jgi:cell wall-associated NlpC family hydrolase